LKLSHFDTRLLRFILEHTFRFGGCPLHRAFLTFKEHDSISKLTQLSERMVDENLGSDEKYA